MLVGEVARATIAVRVALAAIAADDRQLAAFTRDHGIADAGAGTTAEAVAPDRGLPGHGGPPVVAISGPPAHGGG